MLTQLSVLDAPASINDAHALLSATLDSSGYIAVVGLKEGHATIQTFYAPGDYQGACDQAERLSGKGYDAYFATSTFSTNTSRKADSASAVKVFKVDLDVGDDPKKYPNQRAAVAAMLAYCSSHGLPVPVLVSSGWGVHCYWILTEALDQSDGKLYAEKFKAALLADSLKMDPTVTGDIARILRVPGTNNYKVEGHPKPVRLKSDITFVDTDEMLDHIDRLYGSDDVPQFVRPELPGTLDGLAIPAHSKGVPLDRMTRSMLEGKPKKFSVLLQRSIDGSGRGCAQIQYGHDKQASLEEPRWRSLLSVARFCEDGDEAIHLVSQHHQGYDHDATVAKAALIPAPHTCKHFVTNWPKECDGCQHKNKITSPIQLGFDDHAANDDDGAIQRLASLPKFEYDRVRAKEAKALGVRAGTLDERVNAERAKKQEATNSPFDAVEPWDDPIAVADLLDELSSTVRRYILCDKEFADTAALWAAMTWVIDAFQIAPLAIVSAPEKRCGKSEFRRLMAKFVYRPLEADGMSASVLFRGFDLWRPTLLVDEFDTFVKEDEALRGIFNAGHQRGGCIWRCVGDDHEPKSFHVFGPKLLAGIGRLPGTMEDRAIIFELRRKLPYEQVERLRYADPMIFETVRRKLARFAQDHLDALRAARPTIPGELNDRQQDNWEPLLAIAELACGGWPELARQAALKLSADKDDASGIQTELLGDIHDIFGASGQTAIFSSILAQALATDEEGRWATYNRGKPITARQIATKLNGYGIAPKNVRIDGRQAKGYEAAQFEDAFKRYLPSSEESAI